MKFSILFITAVIGLATAAPAVSNDIPSNGMEDIDKRQVSGGACQKCVNYFNDCYKGCWWVSSCTQVCNCRTSQYLNCKPQCGYSC